MVVIFLLCLLGFVTAQTKFCHDEDECKGQTITSAAVQCYGDYGCQNADITATTNHVYCNGNHGCNGADITTQTYDVYCMGNFGCYGSEITAKRSVQCHGYYSCDSAQIKSAKSVYAYGHAALYNARIDTEAQTDALIVYSYGYRSGYNADIICRSGRTCTLNCQNDGCQNLDFSCLSGSTCTVSPSGCTISNPGATVGRVICPSYASSTSPFMDNDLLRKLEEKRLIKNKEKPDDFEEPEPQEPDDYDDNNNRYYIRNRPEGNDNNYNKYYIKVDSDYYIMLFVIVVLAFTVIFLLICYVWDCLKGKKHVHDLVSYKTDIQ